MTGSYAKTVSGNTICELCPANVRGCTSPTEHTSCAQGYYVTSNKKCEKCPDSNPNCLNSRKYDNPDCLLPTSTTRVYDNTYGKGGKCYACSPGCKDCLDGNTCDKCISNTFWDSSSKTCKSCRSEFGDDCSKCTRTECTEECFFNETKFFGKCMDSATAVFYYGVIGIVLLCLVCFGPLCVLIPWKMVKDRKERERGNLEMNNNGRPVMSMPNDKDIL